MGLAGVGEAPTPLGFRDSPSPDDPPGRRRPRHEGRVRRGGRVGLVLRGRGTGGTIVRV